MDKEETLFTKEELYDLNGITSSRHGFIIPFSLDPLLDAMTVQEQGFILSAMRHYVKTGEVLEVNNKSFPYVALKQFVVQYKKDAAKYLVTVKQNRVNGAKGGSVQKNTNR